MNRIAIVIPIYNVENYLDECVRSCLVQNYEDFEIILVNDGSRDASFDIALQYAKEYDYITLIDKDNIGLGSARNAGLMYLSGEFDEYLDKKWHETMQVYHIEKNNNEQVKRIFSHAPRRKDCKWVIFLDSDDYLAYDTLSSCADYIKDCNVLCFDEKPFVDPADGKIYTNIDIPKSYFEYFEFSKLPYANTNNWLNFLDSNNKNSFWWGRHGMIRIDFLKKYNLRFPQEIYHEDNAFGPALLFLAENIAFLNKKLYFYRLRAGSIMNRTNAINKDTLSSSMQFLYDKFNGDLAEARAYFRSYSFVRIASYIHDIIINSKREEWLIEKFIRIFYQILIEESNNCFSSQNDALCVRENYIDYQQALFKHYARANRILIKHYQDIINKK